MTRTGMARGRIAIVDRVDAAVTAMRINELLKKDPRWPSDPVAGDGVWAIVSMLKRPAIDRSLLRKWADDFLRMPLEPHWTAFLRARVYELEASCGLDHDERSLEAMRVRDNDEAWDAYVARLKVEACPIEIPIPTNAEDGHAHARS